MKARLMVIVAGLSFGLIAACGSANVDSGVEELEPARSEAALGSDCPCGSAGGGACMPCTYICGDGFCDVAHGESSLVCAEDCSPQPVCGDGSCNGTETAATCPQDCGAPSPWCGDGACNGNESAGTCPQDCAGWCGDGVCGPGELGSCYVDCVPGCENPSNCPQDPQG